MNYVLRIRHLLPKRLKNSLLVRRLAVTVLGKPIRVWYWRSPDVINFGDELTPDIITKLFNKKVVRVEVEAADLFAVGSIIEVANQPRRKKAYVWGSGFISAGEGANSPKLVYKAARGAKTRSRLPKKYQGIPLGDPGLLSNLVYKESQTKDGTIGIIPHFMDEDSELLEMAKMSDDYRVISVRDSPSEVIRQITECKIILSSSLHGLIVADSFGIPNIHVQLSDAVHGNNYKFEDYYSAINREYVSLNKNKLYDKIEIDEIISSYEPIENLHEIQSKLINSFPFQ
jgi:hypothetical protein